MVCDGFDGDPVASKLNHFSVMSTIFNKAVEEVKERLRLIIDGEKTLSKQSIILDSIKVPEEDAVNDFLEDMIAQDGLE